jgi:hypothetical protein
MPVVVADRFPVKLLDGDGVVTHEKAKLVLTQPDEHGVGRLLAWTSPEVMVYDVAFRRPSSLIGARSVDWVLDTDLGHVGVRTASGCGCGDRLKGFHPPELLPYQMGRLR